MDNLFHIRNLHCQYKQSDAPVLQLEELDIVRGRIYFMVGVSGVGKSTLLETLGLMTNTLKERKDTVFNFNFYEEEEKQTKPLDKLWKDREKKLAAFRQKHLSFIFQSNNLFENLTAYQNAAISQVLQGKNLVQSQEGAKKILQKIFLDKNIMTKIEEGKKVKAMSGGQKQRLAFVRALGTDFTVLLADEPTGNLDYFNARNLLQFLTDSVKKKGQTAIIVSHDISLATSFGDDVILIRKKKHDQEDHPHRSLPFWRKVISSRKKKRDQKSESLYYGVIDGHSIFRKEPDGNWSHQDKKFTRAELENYLQSQIKESTHQ